MNEICFAACSALIILELIKFLAPDNKAGKFLISTSYILILVSIVISLGSAISFGSLSTPEFEREYVEETGDIYRDSIKHELEKEVGEFLSAQKIAYKCIKAYISVNDSYEYEVKKLSITLNFESDTQRCNTLVSALLENSVPLEVTAV